MNLFENLQMMRENTENKFDVVINKIHNLFNCDIDDIAYDKNKCSFVVYNISYNRATDIEDIIKSNFLDYEDVVVSFERDSKYLNDNIESAYAFKINLIDDLLKENIEDSQISESEEIKYVLTARNMWNKDFSQRTSFLDKVYDSFEEAEAECREFQMNLASHMRAGIEKVKFDSDSNLVRLGSYWELFRGTLEKKSDDE